MTLNSQDDHQRQVICRCPCHNSEVRMLHCFPCCHVCEHCRQRIVSSAYEEHVAVCKPQVGQDER